MHVHTEAIETATPSQYKAGKAHRERLERIAAAALPEQSEPARAVEPDDIMPDKAAASVLAPIPNEAIREAVKLLPDVNQFGIRIDVIIRAVLRHFPNISKVDLLSPRRDYAICRPRQIVMYLAKKMTTRSLPEIARQLGNRDHTTALSAIRRIESLRKTDPKVDADVCAIISALGGIVA